MLKLNIKTINSKYFMNKIKIKLNDIIGKIDLTRKLSNVNWVYEQSLKLYDVSDIFVLFSMIMSIFIYFFVEMVAGFVSVVPEPISWLRDLPEPIPWLRVWLRDYAKKSWLRDWLRDYKKIIPGPGIILFLSALSNFVVI